MTASGITLYELAGADADLRFSPHCWKIRMAFAHKGLEAERVPCLFTEKDKIAFSGQKLVPVLVHDGTTISDSWRIALHLDERFPDRPSLFGHPAAVPLARFINGWSDSILLPAIMRIILVDIYNCLHERDRDYFRASREERLGMKLESVVADRPARLAELRQALSPLRIVLRERNFITGAEPSYADYSVFGMFMWARCTSPTELLEPGDPIEPWRERLLDAFGGLARSAPSMQR